MESNEKGLKLTKSERKLLKKQSKLKSTIFNKSKIILAESNTKKLVVANGGLSNGVQKEQLYELFQPFGSIHNVIMEPGKPYAFVVYSSEAEALAASQALNGNDTSFRTEQGLPIKLYIECVDQVPEEPTQFGKLPPGLLIIPNFISEQEERELISCVQWGADDAEAGEGPRQTLKHRQVKHYGYEFMYGINNIDKDKSLKDSIPGECHAVMGRMVEAGVVHGAPDQLTVNKYSPGQGIPPHIDTHSACEDGLVSISLGSQVVMDFRHPSGSHIPVLLPSRSMLVMTGESRYLWTHGITPRKSDIVPASKDGTGLTLLKRDTRVSFTFRKVKRDTCKCAYPSACDSQQPNVPKPEDDPLLSLNEDTAARLEALHVHKVYEDIAGHFSDTRHTPWPKVVEFLDSLLPGSWVVDVGCGNGKYLGANPNTFKVGCDRSANLCQICRERGHASFVCDCLAVPLRHGCFDGAISIAVIHHLSTQGRRIYAVKQIINLLTPGGKALIYVWAYEQEYKKTKSNYLKESKLNAQNVDITGHCASGSNISKLDSQNGGATSTSINCNDTVNSNIGTCCEHIDTKSDSHDNLANSGESEKYSGEKSASDEPCEVASKLTVHVNRTNFASQDVLVPWHLRGKQDKPNTTSPTKPPGNSADGDLYHRYYHVFREGELEDLCKKAGEIDIVNSYYDKGNWCVIIQKQR